MGLGRAELGGAEIGHFHPGNSPRNEAGLWGFPQESDNSPFVGRWVDPGTPLWGKGQKKSRLSCCGLGSPMLFQGTLGSNGLSVVGHTCNPSTLRKQRRS
jgi:hypothetical protein